MTWWRSGRALIAAVLAINMSACEQAGTPDESGATIAAASFVGSAACGACHEEQKRSW